MTETCWEVLDADISHWGAWCRLFATSDGKTFVIDADIAEPPGWITNIIRRNTAVFLCNENGGVTDLVADYEYRPMTTPEQAIQLMGYELVPQPSEEQLASYQAALAAQPAGPDFGSTA